MANGNIVSKGSIIALFVGIILSLGSWGLIKLIDTREAYATKEEVQSISKNFDCIENRIISRLETLDKNMNDRFMALTNRMDAMQNRR
jgi:hypothetical protein